MSKVLKSSKRSEKIVNNNGITKLERDLEKSSKALQNEIFLIQQSQTEEISIEMLEELDVLFQDVEEYFASRPQGVQKYSNKVYAEIRPKINTNLS